MGVNFNMLVLIFLIFVGKGVKLIFVVNVINLVIWLVKVWVILGYWLLLLLCCLNLVLGGWLNLIVFVLFNKDFKLRLRWLVM